ncbi:methyltransferase domain-containing protein [Streptomyces sp. NPDC101150]|uniref:methyltransferase domain-containing protein n=1 Tax=Streptomyces sp. NPDC101150 TaxID=3366114 RepID=UPI00380453A1
MAVVVVQDPSAETPPLVRKVLDSAGLATRTVRLTDGEEAPADLSGVDGLIILGSPCSARPDGALRAAIPDPALVRDALAAEVPVLALGEGTRLLAECAGAAANSGAARPPLGPQRAADPLDLPADADVPTPRDGHPEQAFRIGASAWGVRFLPQEGTAAGESPSGSALGPLGEELLGRFAALVAARAEHTATRAFFTRRADAWEERFAYQTPVYEAAVARMRLTPGGLAVDLGCGTGRAMPALRTQVGPAGQVLGCDITPAMLTAAARHGRTRHGHLLAADCTRLPLPRASVHGIFSAGLLDHLADPYAALREWARVTAPHGVLLLFHPAGRAERAARHGRPLNPDDLLAENNLRPALETTGWHLDEYEDASGHFLARAVPRG